MCSPQYAYEDQRITYGVSRLSPSTMWVPGIKLRRAGLVVGTFTPWVILPALAAFFCYLLRQSLPVASDLPGDCTDPAPSSEVLCQQTTVTKTSFTVYCRSFGGMQSIEFWVVKAHVSKGWRSRLSSGISPHPLKRCPFTCCGHCHVSSLYLWQQLCCHK